METGICEQPSDAKTCAHVLLDRYIETTVKKAPKSADDLETTFKVPEASELSKTPAPRTETSVTSTNKSLDGSVVQLDKGSSKITCCDVIRNLLVVLVIASNIIIN